MRQALAFSLTVGRVARLWATSDGGTPGARGMEGGARSFLRERLGGVHNLNGGIMAKPERAVKRAGDVHYVNDTPFTE